MDYIGRILVILALVIAVVLGVPGLQLGEQFNFLGWLLAVIGAAWGYMNISSAQTSGFLIVGLALWVSDGALKSVPVAGPFVTEILGSVGIFIAGAMLAVVIRALFDYMKD